MVSSTCLQSYVSEIIFRSCRCIFKKNVIYRLAAYGQYAGMGRVFLSPSSAYAVGIQRVCGIQNRGMCICQPVIQIELSDSVCYNVNLNELILTLHLIVSAPLILILFRLFKIICTGILLINITQIPISLHTLTFLKTISFFKCLCFSNNFTVQLISITVWNFAGF